MFYHAWVLSIWGCWCTCVYFYFLFAGFSSFFGKGVQQGTQTLSSEINSCSIPAAIPPIPPPLFWEWGGSLQQHGAAWWEELVHGTRSKCWDTRLKMQREGGNNGFDNPAPPSMRRLQGSSVNPGHKRRGPNNARELGEPKCCQV